MAIITSSTSSSSLISLTTCLIILTIAFATINATTIYTNNNIDPVNDNIGYPRVPTYAEGFRRHCPVCDSSVYGYCSDKLFHDSCCCHNPDNPYDRLPYQCKFADCSFLHANSCREHKLITACCCTGFYLFRK